MIHKETKTGGCETDEIISPKGKGERRKRNKRETKKSCEYAKVRRKQKGEYRKRTEESKTSRVVDVFKTVSAEAFEKAPYLRNPPLRRVMNILLVAEANSSEMEILATAYLPCEPLLCLAYTSPFFLNYPSLDSSVVIPLW